MRIHRCLAVIIGLLTGTHVAVAQTSEALHIVIVQKDLRGPGAAEVHIMGGADRRNVILVGRKASADDLGAAIEIARHLRAKFGDTLTKDVRAVAGSNKRAAAIDPLAADYRASLARFLDKLDKAKPEKVEKFGNVKYLDFVTSARKSSNGK